MTRLNKKIIFRADGSSSIGLGHIIRSIALADILKSTFCTVFVTKNESIFIRDQITAVCDEVHVIKEENEFLNLLKGDEIVVLDGYHFDTLYQLAIKDRVHKLVAIDDKAEIHFVADLVINPGGALIKESYKKEPYVKLLIGFQYALLRKEFLLAAKKARSVSKVDTAFICMGGADPYNITAKVLEACGGVTYIKTIFVVTGSAYNSKPQLQQSIKKIDAGKKVFLEENINSARMVALICDSEIAICPSSSIAMEACCVKTGLLTGTFVDNQQQTHQLLINAGCCISLGDFSAADAHLIQSKLEALSDVTVINQMLERQAEAIDGLSNYRLLNEFKLLAAC